MNSITKIWLNQVILPYHNKDSLYSHIDSTLSRFNSLRPKSDQYTFDDGRSLLLLCIHGLLPIVYRNASYNIPVNIWFPRDYPKQPPIVYVVPTNDMLVKPGPYIDVSGKCNIDYLQHWERKHEGCNLSALLEAMQDHFSKDSPVYAKPKQQPNLPVSLSKSLDALSSRPPPVPTRPGVSPPLPAFGIYHPPPPLHNTSPPIPPLPPMTTTPLRPYDSMYHPSHPPLNAPTTSLGANNVQLTYSHTPPIFTPHFAPQLPPGHSAPPPPPPPPPPPLSPSAPSNAAPKQAEHRQKPPAHIPNLLDEEDADTANRFSSPHLPTSPLAPPRPPNPELVQLHLQVHQKLTSELNSLTQAFALDAERLRAHQSDLLAGEPAIRDEMSRLEAVRDVCRNVADRTRGAVRTAEANIAELRRKGDPEVDELVCATNIVHNQLINLIADDNSIEDTIYHLHRALNAGRIDLERFLRTTRVLAEEQFMKRALMDKIHAGVSMMSTAIRPEWA